MLALFSRWRRRLRPAPDCPFEQAIVLQEFGYHAAAVCLLRIGVESKLLQILQHESGWRASDHHFIPAAVLANRIAANGWVDHPNRQQLKRFTQKCNSVMHGRCLDRPRLENIVQQAESIRRILADALAVAGGAA
jgi:hypothetical protein